MSEPKHYEYRDAMKLDEEGDYYLRHVMAMTAENLHSKSDIAAQLGYRDQQIDTLRTANQRLEADASRWRYYAPIVASMVGVSIEEMNAEIDAKLAELVGGANE